MGWKTFNKVAYSFLVIISLCLIFHCKGSSTDSSVTGDTLRTLLGCRGFTGPAHDDQLVTTGPATGAVSLLWECEGQLGPASSLHIPPEAAPPGRWVPSSTEKGAGLDVCISLIRKWGQMAWGVTPGEKHLGRLPCTIPSSDQDGSWNGNIYIFRNEVITNFKTRNVTKISRNVQLLL